MHIVEALWKLIVSTHWAVNTSYILCSCSMWSWHIMQGNVLGQFIDKSMSHFNTMVQKQNANSSLAQLKSSSPVIAWRRTANRDFGSWCERSVKACTHIDQDLERLHVWLLGVVQLPHHVRPRVLEMEMRHGTSENIPRVWKRLP